MSIIKLQTDYRCLNDCVQEGCPSHVAELEFNSVTLFYSFKYWGNICHFDAKELEAFIFLLKTLSRRRKDSIDVNNINV